MNDQPDYSQRGEQLIILKALEGQRGHVLDIGAHDGRTFSNSLALIEQGWTATLVEPSPGPFQALRREHQGRPNVQLVQAAIMLHDGLVEFAMSDDMVSTADSLHEARWAAKANYQHVWVAAVTIARLLGALPTLPLFLTLDVEGLNFELLRALPLVVTDTLQLICVEHDARASDMIELLGRRGLERVLAVTEENLIVAR